MIRAVAIVFAGLLTVLMGPVLALAHAPPAAEAAPVLVIGPDAAAVVEASGGRLVGPSIAPMAVLATGDAGFVRRLGQSKAWIVTDGRWMAELCGVRV